MVSLYGSVQAAALAAIGFFLGKEVNRERAEEAESRSKDAENEARTEGKKRAATVQALSGISQYIASTSANAAANRLAGENYEWKQLEQYVHGVQRTLN